MVIFTFFKNIRSSVLNKFIFAYLFLVLIPLAAGGMFIIYNNKNNFEQNYHNALSVSIRQIDYSLFQIISSAENLAQVVSTDPNLIDLLHINKIDDIYIVNTVLNDIIPKFDRIRLQNNTIYGISIIHGNSLIHQVEGYITYDNGVTDGSWEEKIKELSPTGDIIYNNVYIDLADTDLTGNFSSKKTYNVNFPLVSLRTGKIISILQIQVLKKFFIEPMEQINVNGQSIIGVFDWNGDVVYRNEDGLSLSDLDDINSNHFKKTVYNSKPYYIMKQDLKSINCSFYMFLPLNEIQNNNPYAKTIVIILVSSFITLAFITYFISKTLLARLVKLSKTIDSIKEGNFDARVTIRGKDEIARLSTNFNNMIVHIDDLVRKNERLFKQEKEAIYKSLQNQIKPHFLCNALDMVRMTALFENNDKIAQAAEAISNYFRYNILCHTDYVSIKEELKNCTDYIKIFNMIGNDKIKYDVCVGDNMAGNMNRYQILKFILQPVIENVLVHGFQDKKDDCVVLISIDRNDNSINIKIEDNGAGIREDRLNEVKEYMNLDLDSSTVKLKSAGIGLRNILERLKLNYGDKSDLSIESYYGFGTCVTIVLPLTNKIIGG